MTDPTPLPRLGAPAERALAAAGFRSLEDLDGVDRGALLALHGFGPKAIRTLEEAMSAADLSFAD